jgi:dethiobiotin synthetase
MSTPASELPNVLRRSLFIAGTDTGVGKTWFAVQLLEALTRAGVRAAGMKPVAAGAMPTADGLRNEDALALIAASRAKLPYELVNPYCLAEPTSPHLAAAASRITIECALIKANFDTISAQKDTIIVEGAGGWLAPIGSPTTPGQVGPTMADVALALQLPVLLVVGVRLGCINHALLTADAIRRSGLRLIGWVANPVDPAFADQDRFVESLAMRLPEPLLAIGAKFIRQR